jgi:hypothetical protein
MAPPAEVHSFDEREHLERCAAMHAAFVSAIEAHPGGFEEVARRMNKTAKRLRQEIDSLIERGAYKGAPKLGLEDSEEIMKITGSIAPLEAMIGPGAKLVKLPPPSVQSDDPEVLLQAGLRRFGSLTLLWSVTTRSEQLLQIAKAIAGIAEYVQIVVKLAAQTQISLNDKKALGRAHLAVLGAVQGVVSGPETQALLPQMVADFAAAGEILTRRLPEWARDRARG